MFRARHIGHSTVCLVGALTCSVRPFGGLWYPKFQVRQLPSSERLATPGSFRSQLCALGPDPGRHPWDLMVGPFGEAKLVPLLASMLGTDSQDLGHARPMAQPLSYSPRLFAYLIFCVRGNFACTYVAPHT